MGQWAGGAGSLAIRAGHWSGAVGEAIRAARPPGGRVGRTKAVRQLQRYFCGWVSACERNAHGVTGGA
eukprot:scaffold31082_cov56-Isochrysis_galbana.AAC.1